MDLDSIITGDAIEVLPTLPAESIDLVVTDPPYGLSFMGKDWDRAVPYVMVFIQTMLSSMSRRMFLNLPHLNLGG